MRLINLIVYGIRNAEKSPKKGLLEKYPRIKSPRKKGPLEKSSRKKGLRKKNLYEKTAALDLHTRQPPSKLRSAVAHAAKTLEMKSCSCTRGQKGRTVAL